MGDPVQLPATVISDRADKHGYSTSLFKRLQTSGFPVQACVFLLILLLTPIESKVPSCNPECNRVQNVELGIRSWLIAMVQAPNSLASVCVKGRVSDALHADAGHAVQDAPAHCALPSSHLLCRQPAQW